MAFPASPVNNATTVINGITYVYNSTDLTWAPLSSNNAVGITFSTLNSTDNSYLATASGNLSVGTSSPQNTTHISGNALRIDGTTGECGPYLFRAGNNAPDVRFYTSGGTVASPTAIASGINLGQIHFQGHDGTTWQDRAGMWALCEGPVSSGAVPMSLRFFTGNTSSSESVRINSAGNVGVGTTAPISKLSVNGNIGNQYGNLAITHVPVTSVPVGKTKVSFIPTGADQTWVVPTGVTQIFVKMWGAGGGGGNSGGWSHGARGGGGGHALGIIPVTAGETLYIVVGVAGQTNYSGGTTPRYGGGGGMYNNSDNRYAGSGGGYTGIFRTSISQANALMIAGGGGGGGSSRYEDCCWGGAGGGTTGQLGGFTDGRNTSGGGPGTQSGGGAAGLTQNTVGTAGSALLGGYGASNAYGGGGGGGYYGGGGGGYYEANNMCGGGGGSGFLGATVQFGSLHTGCRETPAMYNDNDLPKTLETYNSWAPYAVGGERVLSASQTTNLGGGGGIMVIYY